MCVKLDNMTDLIERKYDKFVGQLIGDVGFTYLLFYFPLECICKFGVCLCVLCIFILF